MNILFPEAVFVAVSVGEMFPYCRKYYEMDDEDGLFHRDIGLQDYIHDKNYINMLSGVILKALGDVIGNDGFKSVYKEIERSSYYSFESRYWNYVTYYVDKCNLEYLKTPVEKRKDKLRNIAKRLVKPPQSYFNLKDDFEYSAKMQHCSIYELVAPEYEKYPDEIIW